MGIKPNHTDRKVKKYTLRDYIEFLGQKEGCKAIWLFGGIMQVLEVWLSTTYN